MPLVGAQETQLALLRLKTLHNPKDCHAALTNGARCFSAASCEPTETHTGNHWQHPVLSQKKSRRASGSAAWTQTKELLRAQI